MNTAVSLCSSSPPLGTYYCYCNKVYISSFTICTSPMIHLVCSTNFALRSSQEKLKAMLMHFFFGGGGGGGRGRQGALWEMCGVIRE